MNEILQKFIKWWQTRDIALGESIFHDDFYCRNVAACASGNYWKNTRASNPEESDIRILASFANAHHGMVVLEETCELTLLHYRHSIALTFKDGLIIEEIDTKEVVDRW